MDLRNALRGALAGPRGQTILLATAVAAVALAGLAGGALSSTVLRVTALLGALALAGVLARRKLASRPNRSAFAVEARQPLSRESGLALVAAEGRRFLVGYGSGSVSLLRELESSAPDEERP